MTRSRVKNSDYIAISGWMISKLHLSGNRLIIFALIHGFSKDEFHKFYGSISYIEEWTNLSRNTVISTLKSLTKDGLIKKTESIKYGISTNQYSAISEPVQELNQCKNFTRGSANSALGGSANSAPNNTILDNNKEYTNSLGQNGISTPQIKSNKVDDLLNRSDITKIAYAIGSCFDKKYLTTDKQKKEIRDEIRKLIDLDNYSPDEIIKVIKWGREDGFWSANFLSPMSLRKKKDGVTKFDKIKASMNKPKFNVQNNFSSIHNTTPSSTYAGKSDDDLLF